MFEPVPQTRGCLFSTPSQNAAYGIGVAVAAIILVAALYLTFKIAMPTSSGTIQGLSWGVVGVTGLLLVALIALGIRKKYCGLAREKQPDDQHPTPPPPPPAHASSTPPPGAPPSHASGVPAASTHPLISSDIVEQYTKNLKHPGCLETVTNYLQRIANIPVQIGSDLLRIIIFYKDGPTGVFGNFFVTPNPIFVFNKYFRCSEAAFQYYKLAKAANERGLIAPPHNIPEDSLFKDWLRTPTSSSQSHTLRQQLKMKYPHNLAYLLGVDPLLHELYDQQDEQGHVIREGANGEQALRICRTLEMAYPNMYPQNWRKGGEGSRDDVMRQVLEAKFDPTQNPEMRKLLDATKGAELYERCPLPGTQDKYWSDGNTGEGCQMLGKMLVAIRDGTPFPQMNDNSDLPKRRAIATAQIERRVPYAIIH